MSHLLYSQRLYWDGRSGAAALHGRYRKITQGPPLWDDANYIDFAPEVRVAQVRRDHGPMRDMTPAESAAAWRYLQAIFVGSTD